MTDDQVSVDLPSAITHKGTAYGPGQSISVPQAVAEKYGLTKQSARKGAAPKAKKGAKKK